MISVGNEKVVRLSTDKEISFGYVGVTEVFPNIKKPTIQSEWVDAGLGTWGSVTTKNSIRLNSTVTEIPSVTDGRRLTSLSWFAANTKLLTNIGYFDTINVNNFTSAFRDCPLLTEIPDFDYSNVTDAQSMFQGCTNLVKIGDMNTPKLRNIISMFASCSSLITPPYIDASNVVDMTEVFWKCTSLVDTPMVDTKNVSKVFRLFEGCSSLTHVPTYDLSSCRDARYMLKNCSKLKELPLFNLNNVELGESLFENCNIANNATVNYDLSSMVNTMKLFNDCKSLGGGDGIILNNCDKIKTMREMFRNCTTTTKIELNSTIGEITPIDVVNCFIRCSQCTEISGVINMENITDSTNMFTNCDNLVEVRLKNLNCDLTLLSKNLSLESLEYLIHNLKTVTQEENRTITLPSNIIDNISYDLWDVVNSKNWTVVNPIMEI